MSSHQPEDLTELIRDHSADHVVVRLYLPWEKPSYLHSLAQIRSTRANNCTVGGYCWLYKTAPSPNTVAEALKVARMEDAVPPVLWLDIERYPPDDTYPTKKQLSESIAQCHHFGVRPGIYTGRHVVPHVDMSDFGDVLNWTALYNGQPDLQIAPYASWTHFAGHQYTSTPVDQSVFLEGVTR